MKKFVSHIISFLAGAIIVVLWVELGRSDGPRGPEDFPYPVAEIIGDPDEGVVYNPEDVSSVRWPKGDSRSVIVPFDTGTLIVANGDAYLFVSLFRGDGFNVDLDYEFFVIDEGDVSTSDKGRKVLEVERLKQRPIGSVEIHGMELIFRYRNVIEMVPGYRYAYATESVSIDSLINSSSSLNDWHSVRDWYE